MDRRAFLASGLALAACGNGPAVGADEIAARLKAFDEQTGRLPPVPTLPRTQPAPALRGLTGIPFGTCMLPDKLEEPGYGELVSTQFSQLTPEWNFQLPAVMQDDGGYDWTWPDRIVAFAQAHGQRIHGTSLVWYSLDDVPAFQRLDGDRAAFARAFRQNILTIAGRYRAVTRSWDVVNEPVAEDGDGLRDSLWSRNLGAEDYMVAAFEAAAEAAPEAVLFVNDYNLELLPAKRATFMRLIDRLRARGVPVGGIGTQTHTPSACRNRPGSSFDTPSRVPSTAPIAAAARNHGSSAGRRPTLDRLPARPAIETHRMKPTAIPEVFRVASQPSHRMIGDRKMPPPVPVRPDSTPMPAPTPTATHSGGGTGVSTARGSRGHRKRTAAIRSRTAIAGL